MSPRYEGKPRDPIPLEQLGRLRRGEPEVLHPQFADLLLQPQPCHGQHRVTSRRDDEPEPCRRLHIIIRRPWQASEVARWCRSSSTRRIRVGNASRASMRSARNSRSTLDRETTSRWSRRADGTPGQARSADRMFPQNLRGSSSSSSFTQAVDTPSVPGPNPRATATCRRRAAHRSASAPGRRGPAHSSGQGRPGHQTRRIAGGMIFADPTGTRHPGCLRPPQIEGMGHRLATGPSRLPVDLDPHPRPHLVTRQ
jgi:hypothetical protein